MKVILFLDDQEASEILEIASEKQTISQTTYDKVLSAIATATSLDQFDKIFSHGQNG